MRKSDYNKINFKNKAIDRITNGKNGGNGASFSGENTSEIKKDSQGKSYVKISEDTASGLKKGSVVYIGDAKQSDGYLSGGDYKATKVSGRGVYKISK